MKRPLMVGRPALISVDFQKAGLNTDYEIPIMPGFGDRAVRAVAVVEAARNARIPVIFLQERHARTLADFGRELDGSEGVHLLEDDPETALIPELTPRPDEYFVPKRRYSGFFGTDLEILLKGLGAQTLFLMGALTDVCVHYTFVDAHQHDYHVRVAADAVCGSSLEAHEAALKAMEYLQSGAVQTTDAFIAAFKAYREDVRPALSVLEPSSL
ncbi:MAG TPA: cysteine hydrolase [Candidatus Dormibacteraeota bacterium]|jgi:nicotinamidase-related amidase|nr:cysteine hydrolase [Candidatus Dormibacteraeota bacterium]